MNNFIVSNFHALIGLSELWNFCFLARDSRVAEMAMDFCIKLHQYLASELDIIEIRSVKSPDCLILRMAKFMREVLIFFFICCAAQ